MTKTTDTSTHYVDNERFLTLLEERKRINDLRKERGQPSAPVTEELGGILLAIANNLSYRWNFIKYTDNGDMIGDAVEACLRYIDNFDSERFKNPFAYFTQICFWAFVRRVQKNKRETEVRRILIDRSGIDLDTFDVGEFDDFGQFAELMKGLEDLD